MIATDTILPDNYWILYDVKLCEVSKSKQRSSLMDYKTLELHKINTVEPFKRRKVVLLLIERMLLWAFDFDE